MNKTENILKNITVLLEYEDIEKKLTDETKSRKDLKNFHHGAIKDYSGINHEEINAQLRENRHDMLSDSGRDHSDTIDDLKHVTKKKTVHTFVAYRGITHKSPKDFNEGDLIHDKGFTSTSLSKNAAHNSVYMPNGRGTAFNIHVHSGTKGAYIAPHARYDHEKEFLIHPGTTFKVHKKNSDGTIDLHVHKQEK